MVKNDSWITQIMGKLLSNFRYEHVNPTSYDLTWSGRYNELVLPVAQFEINTWDKAERQAIWSETRSTDVLTLLPFTLYLLDTLEEIVIPEDIMGLMFLKSSIARVGIEHLHAGLFDPGFYGTGTLEVINLTPYRLNIKKGQRLVQMTFLAAHQPLVSYRLKGSYNGQNLPTP